VSLTIGGFATPRTGTLRGKGGNRGRRDNGVSSTPTANPADELRTLEAPAATPTARPAARPSARSKSANKRPSAGPAALKWQDARLPIVGRLWATAWLPSILLAACLVALMYLLQTSGIATTGYDIQHLQAERDDWQLRNEQLQLELAKRQSLTWIDSEATGRLGMVKPQPTALTYVQVSR
jgi:hypothetical protein